MRGDDAVPRIGGSAVRVDRGGSGTRLPWADILLSAIASVSWALIGMAGTAALGLRLLQADSAGSLGPMTAAVVALGAGGSVTPSGDVSAFGLKGAEVTTAVEITPLGVSLVGALLLSWFFLRSLRAAGVVIRASELLARAGAVVVLFVAALGVPAWAGHDVVTIDGGALGLDDLPGGSESGGIEIPGLGDVGDVGGLLPDRMGDLIDAEAAVGFGVDTAPTLLGGLGWATGVLLIALLASRRTPLPRGWEAVHRVVRPAVSALVTVMLVAVAAGLAAAAYAAIGDDRPRWIAGAALLGAPNGVWLGIPVGLFVPWHGEASGALTRFLPDPLDDLLVGSDQPVTLGRLAELDGRVWLLGVAAAIMMLLAGVLVGVRTPLSTAAGGVTGAGGARGVGALGFAARCALRLGCVSAVALPLLGWLTEVSVDASLSVLGFAAFGTGAELRGHPGMALLLGALWGAGAGTAGALLAYASGAAGRRAAPMARGEVTAGARAYGADSGPYAVSTPYRPPNPDTNPYLRLPEGLREPEDARPPGRVEGDDGAPGGGEVSGEDVFGAPTVTRPFEPPSPRMRRGAPEVPGRPGARGVPPPGRRTPGPPSGASSGASAEASSGASSGEDGSPTPGPPPPGTPRPGSPPRGTPPPGPPPPGRPPPTPPPPGPPRRGR
ncbi:streptophobe family protein [Streptomyces sp. NPDC052023]|uniref:streptophobe family protein n=1 Tax=Streptomyces sp. NPDC052023 TaxID=3365681 RepID=UPI0037D3D127